MMTLQEWDDASDTQREVTARALLPNLPEGFVFAGLQTYAQGDQQHTVAQFAFKESTFVLVPGGEATLGFDAEKWKPNAKERKSWADTMEDYYLADSIQEYLAQCLSAPRTVTIPPLLIETQESRIGWGAFSEEHPEIQEYLEGMKECWSTAEPVGLQNHYGKSYQRLREGNGGFEQHGSEPLLLTSDAAGKITGWLPQPLSHSELCEYIQPFRLLTANEWEYACSGGAKTLFRWGDHIPGLYYPASDPKYNQINSPHLQRNAFGLRIAHSDYEPETLQEFGWEKGGDGGSLSCGGAGFFVVWLLLATAHEGDKEAYSEKARFSWGRRVLPL
jgi:hypothetical protein